MRRSETGGVSGAARTGSKNEADPKMTRPALTLLIAREGYRNEESVTTPEGCLTVRAFKAAVN